MEDAEWAQHDSAKSVHAARMIGRKLPISRNAAPYGVGLHDQVFFSFGNSKCLPYPKRRKRRDLQDLGCATVERRGICRERVPASCAVTNPPAPNGRHGRSAGRYTSAGYSGAPAKPEPSTGTRRARESSLSSRQPRSVGREHSTRGTSLGRNLEGVLRSRQRGSRAAKWPLDRRRRRESIGFAAELPESGGTCHTACARTRLQERLPCGRAVFRGERALPPGSKTAVSPTSHPWFSYYVAVTLCHYSIIM